MTSWDDRAEAAILVNPPKPIYVELVEFWGNVEINMAAGKQNNFTKSD